MDKRARLLYQPQKAEDFLPMQPNMGPPLPRFLQLYWPWYKPVTPPPEPPPGLANVYGKVTGSTTGQPLEGVVAAIGTSSTQTNSLGEYAILELTPGPYSIEFTLAGYQTLTKSINVAAGNNNVTVSLIPEIAPPAALVYASSIRQSSWTDESGNPGIKFEVDVQNNGDAPASCSPVAFIDVSLAGQDQYVPMGTATINPGTTVTFYGQWSWKWGPLEEGDWWRPVNIISEAGVITFAFGLSVYLVSVDIPTQVPAGSEYWADQTIHLPYAADSYYYVGMGIITPTGGKYGPGSKYAPSKALLAAPGFPGKFDIVLDSERDYVIRGVYAQGISYPALAPSTPGIYKVYSYVAYRRWVGGEFVSYSLIWDNLLVGQFEVV